MVTNEMVEKIKKIIEPYLKTFENDVYLFIFKNATIDEEYKYYNTDNAYDWTIYIVSEYINEIGMVKPTKKVAELLQQGIKKEGYKIRLIKTVDLNDSFIKKLFEILNKSNKKFPCDLNGITIPNIYITEGYGYNIKQRKIKKKIKKVI